MAKERGGKIGRRQALLLFATQIILLVLMGLFTTYGPEADAKLVRNYSGECSYTWRKLPQTRQSQKPRERSAPVFSTGRSLIEDVNLLGKFNVEILMQLGGVTNWLDKLCVGKTKIEHAQVRPRTRIQPKVRKIRCEFTRGFLLCGFLAIFVYGQATNAVLEQNSVSPHLNGKRWTLPVTHTLYQDVHVMIWIGFGFLMTFLRRYGQSAVGLTFLVGAVLVQVAMLCDGALNIEQGGKAGLSLEGLLSADVAVAAPLISMGALLGKTTYMQLIFMGVVELVVYTVNKYIGEHYFKAVDAGDSMYVHVFGAYFGLAASFALGLKSKPKAHELEGASYQSDIFAMIGTVFLWLFWPSFNSASLQGNDQQRAIINTLLSIAASCVVSFAMSALVSKESKFNMVHVQNSTLAGGVAIGTAAGMMCQPIGALVIGCLAGILSVLGYKYLTPVIQKRLRIHDTCGVHNLHGMPGILAGLFGAFMAGIASEESYNDSLYQVFPARAPKSGNRLAELSDSLGITAGIDRTAGQQAGYQILTLIVTLGIALISGAITGLIFGMDLCGSISEEERYDDAVHWEMEDDSSHEISQTHEGSSAVVDQIPMAQL